MESALGIAFGGWGSDDLFLLQEPALTGTSGNYLGHEQKMQRVTVSAVARIKCGRMQ